MNPIILICGCRKYEPYLDAAIVRMTRPDWTVIGLLGDPTLTAPTWDKKRHVLTVPNPDTYETLPAKLHAAYSWIFQKLPGIPGIFKTDDDIVFDVDLLTKAIAANKPLPYWGVTASMCQAGPIRAKIIEGRFEDKSLQPSHQSAVYSFGAGYWISAAALPHVRDATADYAGSFLEDVCTGFVMNRAGITPKRTRVPFTEMPRDAQLLSIK
jgi:hypothetical protein